MKIIRISENLLIRKIIFFVLRFSLLPFIIRETIQRHKVTIITYHDISPEIAQKQFTELKKYFTLISLIDYLESRKSGTFNNLPPKSLVITFDDGYKNIYSLKPIIEKHKIPVMFFLCSGIVGTNRHFWFLHFNTYTDTNDIEHLKYCPDIKRLEILAKLGFNESKEYAFPQSLTQEEIRNLSQSPFISLQSHSITHPCLPNCTSDKAYFEISKSKTDLEKNYSLNVYAFSYPNGDYSDREIAYVEEAGYKCALTCDPGFNDANTPIFKLKRNNINEDSNINEFIVKSSGLWAYILLFQRFFIKSPSISVNMTIKPADQN